MAEDRPAIPEPMKRQIRQRCGFGCVVCGLPLYTYEHMEGWANVKRHVTSEITLLCDQHQRERTNGLLPLGWVPKFDRDPYNKREGVSRRFDLHYEGNACELIVGGNDFTREGLVDGNEFVAVAIDRIPLLAFSFDQGHLFLTLQVFDDASDRVVWIERNELRYIPAPWDITLSGRRLCVRERARQFLIDIEFDPPNRVSVHRGRFSLNGLELLMQPGVLCYANTGGVLKGCGTRGCDVAVMVGEPIETGRRGIYFPTVNRGKPDREAIQRWLREATRG